MDCQSPSQAACQCQQHGRRLRVRVALSCRIVPRWDLPYAETRVSDRGLLAEQVGAHCSSSKSRNRSSSSSSSSSSKSRNRSSSSSRKCLPRLQLNHTDSCLGCMTRGPLPVALSGCRVPTLFKPLQRQVQQQPQTQSVPVWVASHAMQYRTSLPLLLLPPQLHSWQTEDLGPRMGVQAFGYH